MDRTIGEMINGSEDPFEEANTEMIRQRIVETPRELGTPLTGDLRLPLHLLCVQGEMPPLDLAELLVDVYPEGLEWKDEDQDTPFQLACWFCQPSIARCFLDGYPAVANIVGHLSFYPLVMASYRYTLHGGEEWMKIVLDLVRYYPRALVEAEDEKDRNLLESIWYFDFNSADEAPSIPTNQDAYKVVRRSVEIALVLVASLAIHIEAKANPDRDDTTSGLDRDWFLSIHEIWDGRSFCYHSTAFRSRILRHLARYGYLLGIPAEVAKSIVDLYPYQLFEPDENGTLPSAVLRETLNEITTLGYEGQKEELKELLEYMEAQQRNFSFFMLRMHPSELAS